jgi:hypothetical protein
MGAPDHPDPESAPACVTRTQVEESLERQSFFRSITHWSSRRRLSVAAAALFAGIAARGSGTAEASNWACCQLARPDQWCGSTSGDPPFWCNYGGFKRVWYCCSNAILWGCGECQSGTGTCFDGPTWYCSYGWNAGYC